MSLSQYCLVYSFSGHSLNLKHKLVKEGEGAAVIEDMEGENEEGAVKLVLCI